MEIFKNKRIMISVGAVISIIAIIIACILILNSDSTKNTVYTINSSFFEDLNILGDLSDNKLNGRHTIISKNSIFRLDGIFEDNIFKSGSLRFNYNNVSYYMNGTFENFNIKEGTFKIITKDKIITKTGSFLDNKLEGKGSLRIENYETGDVLFQYAGTFENDIPQY